MIKYIVERHVVPRFRIYKPPPKQIRAATKKKKVIPENTAINTAAIRSIANKLLKSDVFIIPPFQLKN